MASWPKIARRIRVPLGFAFAFVYFWLARPNPLFLFIGSVFIVLGLAVRALASGHVTKNEQLTMTGPYAYTRNPLYLGSLILASGFVLASRNWWIATISVAFFVIVYVPVIRSEETFLKSKFPEHEDYARNVPVLMPRFSRYGSSAGSFSWALYSKHREYNALVGSLAMIAALILKMSFWK